MPESNCSTSDLLLSGAFAEICGIPKSALHYYVSLGLLQPVFISSNNYKYYSTQQTYTVHLIQILQKAGCSLEEIQSYLTNKQQISDYLELLDEKETRLIHERDELDRTISMLRTMHYFSDYSLNDVYRTPALRKLDKTLSILITHLDQPVRPGTRTYAQAFTKHLKHCDELLSAIKYPIGYIMSEHDFLFEDLQYNAFFSLSNDFFSESESTVKLEKGQYVFYVFKGTPTQKQDAYRTLLHFLEENQYTIVSEIYELNLTNTIPLADETANTILIMIQIC